MTWNYEAPNLGLLFYKQIYRERSVLNMLNATDKNYVNPFIDYYRSLTGFTVDGYCQIENSGATSVFSLRTLYPGLLIGSGYTHDTGKEGDAKIGFFFDHTSGQPIIPGSSVKGVLRSIFELDTTTDGKKFTGEKSLDAFNFFIQEANIDCHEMSIEMVKSLLKEIFGTQDKMGKDIFFDAVIDIDRSKSKKMVSTDFITPHKHIGSSRKPELDQFSNPTPLMFLRVMPEIYFEFRFDLKDGEILKANQKKELFKAIISTLGIGAKTNVGYGQFV